MTIRPYRRTDRKTMKEIHAKAKRQFKFPKSLRGFQVVCDDHGEVIMAAGYKLVPEVTLICPSGGPIHPLVKLKALALLHQRLRDILVGKYTEAIASVPPGLEAYSRHLQRHFLWKESWKTFRMSKEDADGIGR